MSIHVPRIYVALDNKHVGFQSHMIKVEGKINDQPITILIDSGASHSYLNPKMVERYHFLRSNLGKPWMV
jgi:predicted aspartyl protease